MRKPAAADVVLGVLHRARVIPPPGRCILTVHATHRLPHGGVTWCWSVLRRGGPGPWLLAGSRMLLSECAAAPYWGLFEHADGTVSVIPYATRAGRWTSATLIMEGQPEYTPGRCAACGYMSSHPLVDHEGCREQVQKMVVRYRKARNWMVRE